MVADEAGEELAEKHDFDIHRGAFFAEHADEQFSAGHTVYNGTTKFRVPIPDEFAGTALVFKKNACEDDACLQGKCVGSSRAPHLQDRRH